MSSTRTGVLPFVRGIDLARNDLQVGCRCPSLYRTSSNQSQSKRFASDALITAFPTELYKEAGDSERNGYTVTRDYASEETGDCYLCWAQGPLELSVIRSSG